MSRKKFDFLLKKYKIFIVIKDRLLTKKELQEYLRISPAKLDRMIAKKELPYIKLERRVLFKMSDIDAYLEKKTVKK